MDISRKYKRFIVFGTYPYAASGGMMDVCSDFDTEQDAISEADQIDEHRVHVFDRIEGVVVFEKDEERRSGFHCFQGMRVSIAMPEEVPLF